MCVSVYVCVCLVQQLLEHAQQHNYLLMKSSNCESSKLHKLKTRQANEISKTKRTETKLRNFHGCHSVSHKCVYVYVYECVCVCACAHLQNLRRPLSSDTQLHSSQLGQGGVSRKATIAIRVVCRVPVIHNALIIFAWLF